MYTTWIRYEFTLPTLLKMDELARYLSEQKTYEMNGLRPLHEVVYERLGDAIRHANLKPGEPLSANHLAKVLGISRTPVRQALQMLAQDGLVDIVPGRAITVASRSVKEILDILYVRTLIEPQLVGLVVEAITPEQIQELRDIQKQLEQATGDEDLLAWSKIDIAWHEALSDICPNETLAEFYLRLRNRIHRNVNLVNKLNWTSYRAGTEEHGVIIEAIANKDKEAAEKAVQTHLQSIRENVLKQFLG